MPTGFGMGGCFEQTTTYLFNIIEDPHEASNLAAEHPGIVAELVGMLEAARAEGRPFPHNSDKARTPPLPLPLPLPVPLPLPLPLPLNLTLTPALTLTRCPTAYRWRRW